jgi:hypothetical protein
MFAFAFALRAALLLLGSLPPEAASSEPSGRVALLRIAGDERLYVRLAAELRAQRFVVVEVEADAGADVDATLRATGAESAIRVESSPEAVRVWIANAATGKHIFREVVPEQREGLDRAIVALWTVELLRASAFAPRPPVVMAPPAAPPPAGIALAVAPAVAWSPGGLGPSWHLMLGARWQRAAHGGLELVVLVPVVPLRLVRPGGAALISMGLLGVGVYAATSANAARLSAQVAAGAALLAMRATGDAADTFAGQTDQTLSGGPYLRAGAALRASSWLRLRVDALSGVMFPRPVVQFAETSVASWGRPWGAALLGVEAAF